MIPYLQIPSLSLFGLRFHAFGFLVASGFFLGTRLAARRAEKTGLPAQPVYDIGLLFIVFGFLGAHVVDLLAYQPEVFWKEPWRIFYIWSGISSYGGFIGGGIALAVYVRRRNLPFLRYADALMFGLLPGWALGRLGCYTAHDHPGRLSDFFLAVAYPGGPRHDLGFYEALFSIAAAGLIFWIGRKQARQLSEGRIFSLVISLYGVARFFLDFLRADDLPGSDPRYAGLTPGQYCSAALVVWGIYLWRRKRHETPAS